jgi:hypothetical protein
MAPTSIIQNVHLKSLILQCYPFQWHFARAISESESKVSAVIRGRRTLSEMDKAKWARALGCKPEELGV